MFDHISSPHTAISCQAVTKSYGSKSVLKGIDLKVPQGRVLGLLGANGAGKSTLISILTGLNHADSGEVRIAGHDPAHTSQHQFGRIVGLAPQDLGIYPALTVRDNLREFGGLQGLSRKQSRRRADELIESMGLTAQAKQSAGTLSGGQKRRLHTAIAMVHSPKVLFLDEPTVGADVEARSDILNGVKEMAFNGTTVIYTSHYLAEFEQLRADIAFLAGGRIVEQGSLADVVARHARANVRVQLRQRPKTSIAGWRMVEDENPVIEPDHRISNPEEALAELLGMHETQDLGVADINVTQPNLESAYLAMQEEARR